MTFAQKIINFNEHLTYTGLTLPPDIGIMNPYAGDTPQAETVRAIGKAFYEKYYNDDHRRHLILGINPGRFGGGLTGIPFTDPKRLRTECDLHFNIPDAHEQSSVFIYEMINAFGGPEAFYKKLYINSAFPLGFVQIKNGKEVNYNYYDSKTLTDAVRPAIIENIRTQIGMGVYTDVCFCFGTGKNYEFLNKLNNEHGFFGNMVPLEHPRFIMQYKSKHKQEYIDKYLEAFSEL